MPTVHQVDEPREGRLQAGGLQGGLAALGDAQKQARYELRDHGTRFEVLLPKGHLGEGGWAKVGLPVR